MKKYLPVFFLFLSQYGYSLPDLSNGFKTDTNLDVMKKIYTNYGTLPSFLYEYNNGLYYSLSSTGGAVGHYNLNELNKGRYGWPLTRWDNEYIEAEIADTYQYGMEWSEILSEPNDLMGCMLRAPLRYGDITGDGKGELVIVLPSEYSVDWSVFSTTLNKIIFSSKLNYTNSVPESEVPSYLTENLSVSQYQYWLRTGVEADRSGQMEPALRAYGKLYIGDFNKDGTQDIVLWRKLYQSKTKDDPIQGFQLVRQTFLHYQLKDDAYQAVNTDESTIQNWLNANNLTWQKGFPSKSECAGEEGKLIPEMHDTLLNDPDVLK